MNPSVTRFRRELRSSGLCSVVLVAAAFITSLCFAAELPESLAPHFVVPAEFARDTGVYPSPLVMDDGRAIARAAEWPQRRAEIVAKWQSILGPSPAEVANPQIQFIASMPREGYTEHKVLVDIGPGDRRAEGYLLVPAGDGPFPAVFIPFYEPLTSIGRGKPDTLGSIDFGVQLTRRGFVTLSIGTPGWSEPTSDAPQPAPDTRALLVAAGDELKMQPLGYLAYVARNCRRALAAQPNVAAERIGIVGHSYGGKWSMFASCLDDGFAAACWCDPGIVFNEANSSVNYWEPWYLGWTPGSKRKSGVPKPDNPAAGPYVAIHEHNSREMIELHALMAGRPVLVSGGSEDPPQNWRALAHLVAVNKLLGHEHLAGMTNRPMHRPQPADAAVIYEFFEHFLQGARSAGTR